MSVNKLSSRISQIPSSVWETITRIDEYKGSWKSAALPHPEILKNLKQSILITSTGSSTRIEGSRMSDSDIEKLMRGLSIQKFRERDIQEVQGYYELLRNVFESWETIVLSESVIKHFHKELLKYVEKDTLHRGDYKHTENKVHMVNEKGESLGVIFDTTDAALTPSAMQELIEWTRSAFENRTHHPLLIIGNFLIEFLAIHPFVDGNGRLSRLLTNLLLLQSGYAYMPYVSHEKLVEKNKTDYYLALRASQKTRTEESMDVVPWLVFFTSLVLKQSQSAFVLLETDSIEKMLSEKQSAVWHFLSTDEMVSPLQIAEATGILRPTVKQTLDKLVALKRAERIGAGRSTRYRRKI